MNTVLTRLKGRVGKPLEAATKATQLSAAGPGRAAVEDGQAALDRLQERLADVPPPSGAASRQISIPAHATLLPILDAGPIRSRPSSSDPSC